MQMAAKAMTVAAAASPARVVELSSRVEFNMHNAYYEHATEEHFWIQWRFAAVQRLLSNIDLGNRIFEVGCGNGVVQRQFEAAYDVSIEGCDLNFEAMDQGLTTRGQKYLYNVFDQRREWKDHFNSVLLLDTLEHIETPTEFLKAIGSHLVDQGILVVNVPALPVLYSRYDSVQGHVRRYTKQRLRFELESAGFELIDSKYWGGNVVPVAFLRKLLVKFAAEDTVLSQGFAPPGKLAESLLRQLMKLENSGIKLFPFGTSLSAVAKKRGVMK